MTTNETPTPRTDAIAHAGHNESVYIARMTYLARELERELEQERQDRKQADLDTIRALGERNDARKLAADWQMLADLAENKLQEERAIVAALQALVTTDHESKEAFIRRCRQALGMNEAGDPPNQREP